MPHHRTAPIAIALFLGVFGGCATGFERALDRSHRAADRQDYPTAAIHAQEACRRAPWEQKEDVCNEAETMTQKGVGQLKTILGQTQGDTLAGAKVLERMHQIAPEDPALDLGVAQVVSAHHKQCQTMGQSTVGLLRRASCLENLNRETTLPPLHKALASSLANAAAALSDHAQQLSAPANTGTRAFLSHIAACISPDASRESQRVQTLRDYWTATALPLAVSYIRNGAPQPGTASRLCAHLARTHLGDIRCATSLDRAPVPLRYHLDLENVVHGQVSE